MSTLLELRGVTVRYGGVTALDSVSISAEAGKITGLIGPNGAGKSTLFNVVSGLVRPRTGTVVLDGRDITRLVPHQRARLRMARTFQQLELFGVLSVADNVLTAAELRRGWARDNSDPKAETRAALERTGLLDVADERADGLPTGMARLLEVARALATNPRLLLLDEPAAGLNEQESAVLGDLLAGLARDGLAIVLVEHDMDLVMQVCSTITVLNLGQVLMTGTPQQVRTDPAVLAAYLGSAPERTA
ncbi:ABC transporter ATP-binding protein [Dactylosporangium sp. NPDC051484]|uniref:ABC transporter ATP-binding protein n=1 Tax=Dactylosporangium sp. NPDC051484 TaxID=3154942 RepID=UPI00344C4BC6